LRSLPDVVFYAKTVHIVRRDFAFAVIIMHVVDWASMSTPPRSELNVRFSKCCVMHMMICSIDANY